MVSLILKIFALVVATIISIISIADQNSKRFKKILSILCILSSVLAVYLMIEDYNSQNEKVKRELELTSNIENIGVTASEIKNQIDSVNAQTIKSLADRESILAEYNKVTEQLKKQIEYDKLDFKSKGPEISVSSNDIRFMIADTNRYNLQIKYINMGKRTADSFQDQILCLLLDKNTNKFTHFGSTKSNIYSVYPNTETINHFMTNTLYGLQSEMIESDRYMIYVLINVKYEDSIIQKLHETNIGFKWNHKSKKFYKYNNEYQNEIKDYLNKNKIEDFEL